jgi:hypothetical protein
MTLCESEIGGLSSVTPDDVLGADSQYLTKPGNPMWDRSEAQNETELLDWIKPSTIHPESACATIRLAVSENDVWGRVV